MGVRKTERAKYKLIDILLSKIEAPDAQLNDAFTRAVDELMVLIGVNRRTYSVKSRAELKQEQADEARKEYERKRKLETGVDFEAIRKAEREEKQQRQAQVGGDSNG